MSQSHAVIRCRACGRRKTHQGFGLCWTCYRTVGHTGDAYDRSEEEDRRQERRPGDPPFRCLWCGEWKCAGPLRQCEDCRQHYRELAMDMPGRMNDNK